MNEHALFTDFAGFCSKPASQSTCASSPYFTSSLAKDAADGGSSPCS